MGVGDDVGGAIDEEESTGAIVALVLGGGVVIFMPIAVVTRVVVFATGVGVAEVVFDANVVGVDAVGSGVPLALLVAVVGNATLIPAAGMFLAST